jgi:hypothetical protein
MSTDESLFLDRPPPKIVTSRHLGLDLGDDDTSSRSFNTVVE